jgi:hypothetical protein
VRTDQLLKILEVLGLDTKRKQSKGDTDEIKGNKENEIKKGVAAGPIVTNASQLYVVQKETT